MGEKDEEQQESKNPREGPLGDVTPSGDQSDPRARRGQPVADVDDRPVVSTVKPEDYPDRYMQSLVGQKKGG